MIAEPNPIIVPNSVLISGWGDSIDTGLNRKVKDDFEQDINLLAIFIVA